MKVFLIIWIVALTIKAINRANKKVNFKDSPAKDIAIILYIATCVFALIQFIKILT